MEILVLILVVVALVGALKVKTDQMRQKAEVQKNRRKQLREKAIGFCRLCRLRRDQVSII